VPAAPEAAALGRVAVVAGTEEPEIRFEGFARGRTEGAVKGGGVTFLSCASLMAQGACSGPVCGAFAVLWLGVCGVAGIVGGVAGASRAQSGTDVRSAEGRLQAVLDVRTVQEALRDGIEAAARARGASIAVRAEADTLLEATLTKAGTQGAGIDAPVEARMEVRVRLLRAADGAEFIRAQYLHLGERHKLAEWAAEGGAPLLRALGRGYEALAEQIADGVFLLYPFPDQQAALGGTLSAAFGLAPLEPRNRGTLTGDRVFGERFEWTQVDGLQPVLRWQAFPRPTDRAAAPAEMSRVADVTYELLIASEENLSPGAVVYRRAGLAQPEHRLEAALRPKTRYFWTVRARFTLEGKSRVTGWGTTHYMARDGMTAPSRFSYRFRTP
jgi:hypothetical protein